MNIFGLVLVLVGVVGCWANKPEKSKPTLDLEDYIDNGKPEPAKKGDLSVSETGYYSPYSYHGIHGLHGHHHHQQQNYPIYHQAYHHGHGHHGYHAHVPHHYGHAQTYFTGEYGGYGHLGSAHVSYGTEIDHGHSHLHHHR